MTRVTQAPYRPLLELRATTPTELEIPWLDRDVGIQTAPEPPPKTRLQTILERPKYQNKALTPSDIRAVQQELNKDRPFRRRFPNFSATVFGLDELARRLYHSGRYLDAVRRGENPPGPVPTVFAEQDVMAKGGEQASTALIFAARHGFTEIALALIDRMTPAELSYQNKGGYSALTFAAREGHRAIFEAITKRLLAHQVFAQVRPVLNSQSTQDLLKAYVAADPDRAYPYFVKPSPDRIQLPETEHIPPISDEGKTQIYGAQNTELLATYILEHTQFLPKKERQKLEEVLGNVESQELITSVPKDPEKRAIFYACMRQNLEHVSLKVVDPEIPEKLKKSALFGIWDSAGTCGTQQYQQVSLARKLLTGDTSSNIEQTPLEKLEHVLFQLRTQIINQISAQLMTKNPRWNHVHIYNAILSKIGKEAGVAEPMVDYAEDPLMPKLDKEALLKEFQKHYEPCKIIETLISQIPGVLSELIAGQEQPDLFYKNVEDSESPDYYALTDTAMPSLLISLGIFELQEMPGYEMPPFLRQFETSP